MENTTYAFISYSHKDIDFVSLLSAKLKDSGIWVDIWDMDYGDPLQSKIEIGIEKSSEFIIVLSKNSLLSSWVKYESHMALIRYLEDSNYRIIVIRIDDCEVPLRFKPFLYVDCPKDFQRAIDELKNFLRRRRGADTILFRRNFVNRYTEIGSIENYIADSNIHMIYLWGLFGIGKMTLLTEAILRIWQRPKILHITLSDAHIGSRLALDLCSLAKLELPPDGANENELTNCANLALEKIISEKDILVLNQFERVLNDEGNPNEQILELMNHITDISFCSKVPVFIVSTRFPKLPQKILNKVGIVKVSMIETRHLITILHSESSRIERKEYSNLNEIELLANRLWGYPLGANSPHLF